MQERDVLTLPDDCIDWGDTFPEVPDAEALAAMGDVEVGCLAASVVSALSEGCWCAGWLVGAGSACFAFSRLTGPIEWGMAEVAADECAALARLRERLAPRWVEWVSEVDGVVLVDAATLGATE